jgi:hypothetical protein
MQVDKQTVIELLGRGVTALKLTKPSRSSRTASEGNVVRKAVGERPAWPDLRWGAGNVGSGSHAAGLAEAKRATDPRSHEPDGAAEVEAAPQAA